MIQTRESTSDKLSGGRLTRAALSEEENGTQARVAAEQCDCANYDLCVRHPALARLTTTHTPGNAQANRNGEPERLPGLLATDRTKLIAEGIGWWRST